MAQPILPNFSRFLVGCAHHTVSHLPYIIGASSIGAGETIVYFCAVVEYCGIASRTLPLMVMIVSYTLASLLLPLLTAFLPAWNVLAFIAASSVLPVLLCWRCAHLNVYFIAQLGWFLSLQAGCYSRVGRVRPSNNFKRWQSGTRPTSR